MDRDGRPSLLVEMVDIKAQKHHHVCTMIKTNGINDDIISILTSGIFNNIIMIG